MFELFYKAGKSFADSFFIGREGKDVTVISASEVLPLDMQKKIAGAEDELNKAAENVVENPGSDSENIANMEEIKNKAESIKQDANEAIAHEEGEMGEGGAPVVEETEVKAEIPVGRASKSVDADEIYKKAGVPTPEFVAKQIASVCKDYAGFKQFCKEASASHAEMVKKASIKKEAKAEDDVTFTFNRTEDGKVPQEKATAGAVFSVNEKEAKADAKQGVKEAGAVSSPVKSYFGRLPGNGGGDAVESINRQSSLKEQFLKLSAELDEMKKEKENADKEVKKLEDENKNMKEEISNGNKDKDINAIISEIKKVVKVQKENVFKDKLVKADEKALKVVLDVVKEIVKLSDGEKADKDVAGLFGGEAKKDNKKEEVVDFTEVKASKRMPGQNIPQIFSQYSGGTDTGLDKLFE